jgi:molybdenum cofactor guanylyltransferase
MASEAETTEDLGSGGALGAVLAGGRGSRIGGAKATVQLAGRPLISHSLAAFEAAGIEPVVVAKPASALPPLSCRVIREPELPWHPLCGILAALRAAEGRPVVVLACDMPLAAPALLAHLAAASERLLVPALAGRLHPLQARYGAELLTELEAALEREEPLRRTVESLAPSLLEEEQIARFGEPERLLFNVNDGDDLRRAEQLLTAQ